jgi:hypothetical protein
VIFGPDKSALRPKEDSPLEAGATKEWDFEIPLEHFGGAIHGSSWRSGNIKPAVKLVLYLFTITHCKLSTISTRFIAIY